MSSAEHLSPSAVILRCSYNTHHAQQRAHGGAAPRRRPKKRRPKSTPPRRFFSYANASSFCMRMRVLFFLSHTLFVPSISPHLVIFSLCAPGPASRRTPSRSSLSFLTHQHHFRHHHQTSSHHHQHHHPISSNLKHHHHPSSSNLKHRHHPSFTHHNHHQHPTINIHIMRTQLQLHPMISSFQPSILAVFPHFNRAKKRRPGAVV